MTLLEYWDATSPGDFVAACNLLPPRALPGPLFHRIQTLAANGRLPAYELAKLRQTLGRYPYAGVATPPPPPPTVRESPTVAPLVAPPATPAVAKSLHKIHNHYHALMVAESQKAEPEKKVLAEYAREIVRITQELDAIYEQHKKHGKGKKAA